MKTLPILSMTLIGICCMLNVETSYAQCYGTTSVCINGSGTYQYSGSSTRIRWSISGGGTIVGSTASKNISVTWTGAGTRYVYLDDLMNSSGNCSIAVTVKDAIGGSINPASTTVCQGANQVLSLSGHMGSVLRWEKSENDGVWQTISTTSTSYTATNISTKTAFRALISNCSKQVYSGIGTVYVEVPNAGTVSIISGSNVFCEGSSTSGTLQLNNYSGDIRRWEKSEFVAGAWSSWSTAGGADNTLTFSTSVETRYRAIVRNLICYDSPSSYFTITKTPGTTPGVISATKPSPICPSEAFSLTISGNIGSVTKWEISDEVHGWTSLSSPNSITITRSSQFRAVVQNGSCPSKLTNVLTMDSTEPISSGSIGYDHIICYNGDVPAFTNTASPSGASGIYTYQWQIRPPGGVWSNISGANSIAYDHGTLTTPQEFRRGATSCGQTAYTLPVTVSLYSTPVPGSISGSQTICYNSDVSPFQNTAYPTYGNGSYSYQWQMRVPGGAWSNIAGATSVTYDHGQLTATREFRRAVISCGLTAYTLPLTVTIDQSSVGGTVGPSVEAYGAASGSLTLTGHFGEIQKWQQRLEYGNWVDIGTTSTTLPYANLTSTSIYQVLVKNGTCPPATSNEVTVFVYPVPTFQIVGSDHITPGGSTELVTDAGLYSYEWFRNSELITGESVFKMTVRKPGAYKVRVKRTATSNSYTTGEIVIGESIDNQSIPINYVKTTAFLKEGIAAYSDVYGLNPEEYKQAVQYFDGLGRQLQSVTLGESPLGQDMVQPVSYDSYGREARRYLPYARHVRDGRYVIDATSEQNYFYQSDPVIANDLKPFADHVFEPIPLNRILKTGGAGIAWQPNNEPYSMDDRTLKMRHEGNGANEVLLFKYDYQTNKISALRGGLLEYYGPNTLEKNKVYDEHSHVIIEYVDRYGRTVLKRTQAETSEMPIDDSNYASTYYVYDDFGNLVTVLPPAGVKLLSNYHYADPASQEAFLSHWAFRYRYDYRKRMAQKQIPGAKPVYLVYDNRDRLVLTQDGNQRSTSTQYWTFTKYDELNRAILTGIKDTSVLLGQPEMQAVVNAYYQKSSARLGESYIGDVTGNVHGYSNKSYPVITSGSTTDPGDYLTVTYYDNYDFRDNHVGASYDYVPKDLAGQSGTYFEIVNGLVTGTKNAVLGTSDYLWNVNYYDDRYRTIQIIKQNYKGGIDRNTTVYDFTGKVSVTKMTHKSAEVTELSSKYRNEYDHAGRLIKAYNTISEQENAVTWIDKVGVSESEGDLTKTGASGAYDAGARTQNYLLERQDGWFEVTVQSDYRVLIGLTDYDADANYTSIDYAIYLSGGWGLYVYENGSNKGAFGNYSVGDVVRVERTGGTVTYKRNGTVFYTSAIPSDTKLFGDVSLFYNGGKITGARMSAGAEYLLVTNKYNELGQLIDKTLTARDDGYVQSIDYRYNIRGWLTSINNAQLTQALLTNDDRNDLFGMELLYNTQEAGLGNTGLYDGNISAIKWKTPVEQAAALEGQKAYLFDYDPMSRLKAASYKAYQMTTSDWTGEANNFNEVLSYDLNGNIETLQRNSRKPGASAFSIVSQTIDDLRYTYLNGNQLSQVEDPTLNELGFNNGASASSEYLYDDNGNMIKDLNKSIDSITYNHLNLPSLITFSNGNIIQYTYDATGIKLKQTLTESSVTKVTDYVSPFVYEQDTLRFFSIPEGRIVNNNGNYEYQFMLTDHLGNTRVLYGDPFETGNVLSNGDCKTLDYFINAQNVTRTAENLNGESYIKFVSNQATSTPGMITGYINVLPGEKYTFKVKGFRANNPTSPAYLYVWTNSGDLIWPGTNLPYGQASENWVFNDFTVPDGVTSIRLGVLWRQVEGLSVGDAFYLNEVGLFKHQDDDHPAGFELAEQLNEGTRFQNYHTGKINNTGTYSHTGSSAYRLTASTQISNEVIGPAKSIRVYPGDAVQMEVYGRYLSATSDGTNVGAVIAGALQSAFNLSGGGTTDLAFQSISNLFGDGAIVGTLAYPYEDEVLPKAFLNYILFDDDYVPYDFGYDQIGVDGAIPGSSSNKMSLVAKVTKPGYIYIYLSNENELVQEVYFDDLAIKHVKGVAIQQSDYYPFGLTFNSYQRENSVEQRWKFQGQEHIDDLGLNWDSFKWRNHQPDIGRFFNIDPLAEKYVHNSPYAFSENKVTAHVELEGLEAESIKKIGQGFVGVAEKIASSDTYQEISRGFGKLAEKMGLKNLLFSKNIPRDDGPPRQQDGNNLIIHHDGPPGPDHKNAATPDPEGDTYDAPKDVIDATGKITKPTVRATPQDVGERAENFASGVESGVEAGKTFVKNVMTDKGDNVNLEVKDVKNRADAKNFGWVTITTTSGRDSAVQVSNH